MLNRSWIANALTAVLAILALGIGGFTLRRELTPSARQMPRASIEKNWARFAAEGHGLGDTSAKVTIVEFADFQCPFCQRFSRYVDSLRILGKSVRVVYRHLPAAGHPHAIAAIRASECAANQRHFAEIHSALTTHPDSIGVVPWEWFGSAANVPDLPAFLTCMTASDPIQSLERDTLAANALRVQGTPTLLIHDQRYNGLPPFDSLLAYVDRAERARLP